MKKIVKSLSVIIIVVCMTVTLTACPSKANFVPNNNEINNENNNNHQQEQTPTTYTVTLDRQNGTGGSSSVQAKYNEPMPIANMPTRTNYSFGGYFSSTNGSGTQYYASNMASLRSWDKQSSETLYAYWISDYNTVVLSTANFSQYFTVTSQWVLQKGIISNGYAQAKAKWTITLKPGVTVRSDSNASFMFIVTGSVAYGFISLSSFDFSFGKSGESSTVSVYYNPSSQPTTTPSTVSGTLYIKK